MKSLLIKISLLLIIATPSLAAAPDAKDIIERSDRAVNGETQISDVIITIKARRWTREMHLRSWVRKSERKSFSEILSPAKDAGNRFLLIGDNMWHYLPKLQQTIKISPSMMLQSWMGSDFTNDDIVKESSIVKDYTHTLAGEEEVDGFRCYRIELIPKPEAPVVWGKIIYYARTDDVLPVREELYNEHGVLKKVLTCSEFRKVDDRVIPTLYKMRSEGKKDEYTLMRVKNAKFNIKLPSNVFTMHNLEKR